MCEHKNFQAQVDVIRLTDDKGNVNGYTTDITINCADCFKPFEWVGLPMGVNNTKPCVSVDGIQLRAPIKPII